MGAEVSACCQEFPSADLSDITDQNYGDNDYIKNYDVLQQRHSNVYPDLVNTKTSGSMDSLLLSDTDDECKYGNDEDEDEDEDSDADSVSITALKEYFLQNTIPPPITTERLIENISAFHQRFHPLVHSAFKRERDEGSEYEQQLVRSGSHSSFQCGQLLTQSQLPDSYREFVGNFLVEPDATNADKYSDKFLEKQYKKDVYYACKNGSTLQLIVALSRFDYPANEVQLDDYFTPLHVAVANDNIEVAKYILANMNVDLNRKESEGTSVLNFARLRDNKVMMDVLASFQKKMPGSQSMIEVSTDIAVDPSEQIGCNVSKLRNAAKPEDGHSAASSSVTEHVAADTPVLTTQSNSMSDVLAVGADVGLPFAQPEQGNSAMSTRISRTRSFTSKEQELEDLQKIKSKDLLVYENGHPAVVAKKPRNMRRKLGKMMGKAVVKIQSLRAFNPRKNTQTSG